MTHNDTVALVSFRIVGGDEFAPLVPRLLHHRVLVPQVVIEDPDKLPLDDDEDCASLSVLQ